MAQFGPVKAFLLVGGNNLSAESYSLNESVEEIVEETRGLGVADETYKPTGIAKATLEATPGLYDDRTFGQLAALEANQDTRKLVSYGFAGFAGGEVATMIDGAFSATWKRMAKKDGLTLAGGTFVVSGQHYANGRIIGGIVSRSGDGNTESASFDNADDVVAKNIVDSNSDDSVNVTAHGFATGDHVLIAGHDSTPSIDGNQVITVVDVDNFTLDGVDITVGGTAVGTVKLVSSLSWIADLHIAALNLGGGTQVDVKIRDSVDDISWTDLASGAFAAATSETAGTAQRLSVTGLVRRFLSITWTFTGGAAQTVTPYVVLRRA